MKLCLEDIIICSIAVVLITAGAIGLQQPSNALGATLENPTIKDMFFGFVVAGQLAHSGNYDLKQADQISDQMMKQRGKK